MSKKIGVIGITGRTGSLVAREILSTPNYFLGPCFSRTQNPYISLENLFKENDYIIDFSSADLINNILEQALLNPKPLIICTTGWEQDIFKTQIDLLSEKAPVVIAPNTSIGATIQRYLSKKLAGVLDTQYDIDILEKHHNKKMDAPSGTAKSLASEIKLAKLNELDLKYEIHKEFAGSRPKNSINILSQRSGNLPGEHEVFFTSEEEAISIKHTAFNREVFAKGALKIVDWLEKKAKKTGIYTMLDILELKI